MCPYDILNQPVEKRVYILRMFFLLAFKIFVRFLHEKLQKWALGLD